MARLVTVTGGLALVAVLLTGCGGGSDDRTKVEDSLRHYISGMHPEEGAFPTDAGPPRVQDKSCKDRHVTTKRGQVHTIHSATKSTPSGVRAVVLHRHIQEQPHAARARRREWLRGRGGSGDIPGGVPERPKTKPGSYIHRLNGRRLTAVFLGAAAAAPAPSLFSLPGVVCLGNNRFGLTRIGRYCESCWRFVGLGGRAVRLAVWNGSSCVTGARSGSWRNAQRLSG
jgi:hypothetical protein